METEIYEFNWLSMHINMIFVYYFIRTIKKVD